jgi:hypothetical protein
MQSAAPPKPDHRGIHWRDKVAAGQGPKCSEHNVLWAECARRTETELYELLRKAGVKDYIMPWRRGFWTQNHTGNSIKALFMQLMIHHLNKVVAIEFIDGSQLGHACDTSIDKGFMGIQRFTILQPEAFNGSTEYGAIHTVEWARTHLTPTQLKTNAKLWNSTGLRISAENVYAFNPILRKRHLEFNARLNESRMQNPKKKKCAAQAEPPTNPAASISFLLCSPDDILRQDRA